MFICTPCRTHNGLHERLAKSEGPCEVCNTYDLCDDWPSAQIPANVVLVSGRKKTMSKAYVIEKTLQVTVSEADLNPGEELTEDFALEIAKEIGDTEWQQVDIYVTGFYE